MTSEDIIQEVVEKLELEIEGTVKRIDSLCDTAENTGYDVYREGNIVTVSGRKPCYVQRLQSEFDRLRGVFFGLQFAIKQLKRSDY